MIHVLNHNSEIIDFISRSDNVVIHSEYKREKENNSELLDLTILSSRAKHFKENNRIIIQDKSNQYREFIIQHIEDSGQYIDVEATASYVVDIGTAKPIPAGKYEKMSVTQKLDEVLRDTDWVTGDCDYGGVRTNSWTSVRTPYEMISQLETSHALESDFEIIIEGNEVVERRVNMRKPNSLFKGKEIEYGKDLTEMKRTVDFSEVVTALFAFGPEDDKGNRISLVVTDDEAQEQFGLPTRYIWGIYEPESDDENMTTDRLKTLARTELNKRKSATVSYEISTFDIEKQFPHEVIRFGDKVRIKNSDFVPSLYAESEVIGFTHDLISDDIVYTFGNVVEYAEDDLLKYFKGKLNEINQKLNDNFTNINTIVNDAVAGELEYYERKIFKGAEPPENPQNDTLWYDTSNPDVAVLRRYWNGEWITQTADDVEKIGGLRREQVMYRDLNNSFINLTIQHSKLQNDVYDVLNNEYLVDDDLKANLNQALSDVDSVYQNIKTNLDSMDEDTATIGKLVDTQTLFTVYREKLQTLYKYVTDAKISIDKRLKLLQSQYTDEKFNDAMDKIAQTLPNGRWDSENQRLYADIPNRNDVNNVRQALQEYTDGQISDLNSVLGKEIDSKINTTKSEINANISSVERKIDGIEVGGRNLALNSNALYQNSNYLIAEYTLSKPMEVGKTYTITVKGNVENTDGGLAILCDKGRYFISRNTDKISENIYRVTFEAVNDRYITDNIRLYNFPNSTSISADIEWIKLEEGNKGTDWTPAPEDLQRQIQQSQKDAEESAKAYANAQDELKQTETKAYADGIVTKEEQRSIADAIAKRDEAKRYAEQKAQEAQNAANQNTLNAIKPITTRVTTNETKISELDKQISLMAKSDDVAQKLRDVDGRLTPLETTVESNKATLDILPTQIDSKVSKQDYTLDKDEIVTRLDNADSQRQQLSNEITDKVTITKFESGIAEAKNYTDNIKQQTTTYTDDKFNNLSVGGRNLALNSNVLYQNSNYLIAEYTLSKPMEVGKTYTITVKGNVENTNGGLAILCDKGRYFISRNTDKISDNIYRVTFEAVNDRYITDNIRLYNFPNSTSISADIEWIKLEEGNKGTDWTPAPEDVKENIQQAETNAKAYTDAYKKSNEVAMTKLETSVSQLDGKVSIKVDEQKFNASRKTLSQVIAEISATTKGINLSYDENGNIQSYTMDRNGIKIDGSKIDINQGDVVIQNGVTTIKDAYIDKLFSKNATIQYLNSIDITAKRLQSIDNNANVNIENGSITMTRADKEKLNLGVNGISMYNSNGSKRFSIDERLVTSAALGTSNANVYLGTGSNYEARIVDVSGLPSDGYVDSYRYRPLRAEGFYGNYWNINTADALGNPKNLYARPLSGGELRVTLNENTSNYQNVRVDGIFANFINVNELQGNSRNLYLMPLNNGEVRSTISGQVNNYAPIRAKSFYLEGGQIADNSSGNSYIGTNGEWRFTSNQFYNGGNTTYRDIRFGNWHAMSSEKFKYDIKEWNYSVLDAFRNDLQLYSYKLNSEKETNYARNHHGIIIEREIPIEWRHGDGFDGNEVMFWNTKAIQELIKKVDQLEEQLNAGSNTN
ncbi:phage tail spike protein [Staphylococcus borealis]|uniref:phage tail spike protein n=1 Tax=Staphylococcus borealis TaxID=2742203 RepID=UPI00374F621F